MVRVQRNHLWRLCRGDPRARRVRRIRRADHEQDPNVFDFRQRGDDHRNGGRASRRQGQPRPVAEPGLVCLRGRGEPDNVADGLGFCAGVPGPHLVDWVLRLVRAYERGSAACGQGGAAGDHLVVGLRHGPRISGFVRDCRDDGPGC